MNQHTLYRPRSIADPGNGGGGAEDATDDFGEHGGPIPIDGCAANLRFDLLADRGRDLDLGRR